MGSSSHNSLLEVEEEISEESSQFESDSDISYGSSEDDQPASRKRGISTEERSKSNFGIQQTSHNFDVEDVDADEERKVLKNRRASKAIEKVKKMETVNLDTNRLGGRR
jgi:hypothetical protein